MIPKKVKLIGLLGLFFVGAATVPMGATLCTTDGFLVGALIALSGFVNILIAGYWADGVMKK